MTYNDVKKMYSDKGYIFLTGPYKVNLFGIRNKDLTAVDYFNDILGVAYQDSFGNNQCLVFAGTTKPGLSYLGDKVGNPDGTAILCPGQHLNAWATGFHHANDPEKRYPAYVQRAPGVFTVWRDADKDGKFDFSGTVYTNSQGINGHRGGINPTQKVGLYSMGCQVMQEDTEHHIWYGVGERHAELYGNSLHYTLFQAA